MSPAARRAAGLLAVGVALAVACTFLGRWQWHRYVVRNAAIAVVEAGYAADPVPLGRVLDSPEASLPDDEVWRPVTVVGHYEPDATVLLRNRPVAGTPSYHVLVPFVVENATDGTASALTGDGPVLVVDRGWVPVGEDAGGAVDVPSPPRGTVTLTARLRQDEPPSARSAPAGQVQAISVQQVLAAGGLDGEDTYAAYGALVDEDPVVSPRPGALPPASTNPGSHLSYAFQWWVFAIGSLVGFSVLARRELRADAGRPSGPAPAAPDVPRRRGGRAEDEEDALVDAQLAADPPGGRPVRPGR